MAKKKAASKATPKAAPKAAPVKDFDVYGIDDMTTAIFEYLQERTDIPQSAKELTKTAIKTVLQTEQAMIMGAVAGGDKVTYIGFGTYEKRERSARTGRNPQTGEELHIEAKTVPAFKPGKGFKDAVL